MIRTIKPEDVTEQENKIYAKIVQSKILDCFELEELRDLIRTRSYLRERGKIYTKKLNNKLNEIFKIVQEMEA